MLKGYCAFLFTYRWHMSILAVVIEKRLPHIGGDLQRSGATIYFYGQTEKRLDAKSNIR